jgi:two-component system CheB/CheR fusion protein
MSAQTPFKKSFLYNQGQFAETTDPEFETLLNFLKHERGCDLTGYKRTTLMRRFKHRMRSLNIHSYHNYLEHLKNHSEEYLALLNDVLINVTSFFRDSDAWSYLATEIIPKIIASKQPGESIRIWSAGCAAGQEIYSLLILMAETLGIESCLKRVQCYATDMDEAALSQARQGTFSALEVSSISPELLQKYFVQTEQGYVFHPGLRHTIIFGHHDLLKDAPMSKIDLLICRNVLIYFNLEAQAAILTRFRFALKPTGFLFLGKSEALAYQKQIFTPVNLKQHIYTKGLELELLDYLLIKPKTARQQAIDPLSLEHHFWKVAFEANPLPQFAVALNGKLVSASHQANLLFRLTIADWKRPFYELTPGKLVASHTSIQSAYYNRQLVTLKNIEWNASEEIQYFDVAIAPVLDSRKQLIGNIVTFYDKTDSKHCVDQSKHTAKELKRISEALQDKQRELESAYQEIQILTKDTHHYL